MITWALVLGGSSILKVVLVVLDALFFAGMAEAKSHGKKKGTTVPLNTFLRPETSDWADEDVENETGELISLYNSLDWRSWLPNVFLRLSASSAWSRNLNIEIQSMVSAFQQYDRS